MNRFPNKKGSHFGYQKSPTVASSSFGSSSYRKDKGVVDASSIIMLKDVDPMLDNITIQGRCISLWHSHRMNEAHNPYSLDLVLQDSQISIMCLYNLMLAGRYGGRLQSDAGRKIRRTVVIKDFESNQLDCTFWDHWVNTWDEYALKRDELGHVVFILQLGKKSHCIVYAKIHRIHKENGWEYTACKECNKKVNVVERKAMSSAVKSKVTFYCEDHGIVQVA
ncbi:replication protein A 70 kDa DNA-binding subunit B [Tanacetum coccineum]